ncbi:MAG: glycoside hydrolase [Pirellulales bacterium]|nr:glycoside hydrolase [Pirellulales bacterium]
MSVFVQFCVLLVAFSCFCPAPTAADDPRNARFGSVIPDEGYCDQPYVVVTKNGNWLCTLTTGAGHEGTKGQHVVSTISTDKGKTWSGLVDIEPSDGPEASWVTPLIVPDGRVYVFYTYNGDKIRTLPGKKKGCRTDMLGWYCFKYSDDGGKSWSKRRYRLPVRVTACDLANNWGGKVQIFWGIDKPKISDGCAIFAFTKLGRYMLDNGEGWLFRSDNILTETDPTKLHWTLLPDGEHGIRAPEFGSVQEEHNIVPLDGNNLYCVYRTTTGYPCQSYSDDGGHTWTKPEHMTYTPGGRKIKTSRACPKLWRTADGRFLFWFHNHSGRDFNGRNPAWISGGVERDGRIHWSQPEILLYDPVVDTRMSYPDMVEQDGRYWITETNKSVARVHEIDKSLLEGLWRQGQVKTVVRKGLVLQRRFGPGDARNCDIPHGINLSETGGLTLDCWIRLDDLTPGQTILDSRDSNGKGVALSIVKDGAVRLELSDGKTTAAWDCDPGLLQAGKLHHVVAIADAGPRIITFVVDGVLCDGGQHRQYGWGRWRGKLGTVLEAGPLAAGPSLKSLRVYDR